MCEGDHECGGRQVCADAGACELAEACTADVDCPGGLSCNPETGLCNGCDTDGDCVSAGLGVACGESPSGSYRRCLEPDGGFCEGDGQCTGNRTCDQGFCGPNPEFRCEGDILYGRSDNMGGVERVGIDGAPFDGTLHIRVSGVEGAHATPYVLGLAVGPD